MKARVLGLAAAGCLLLAAGAAHANSTGELELRYDSVKPKRTAKIYLNDVSKGYVYTGLYNLKLNPDPSTHSGEGTDLVESVAPFDFMAGSFCGDVMQYVPTSYQKYDVYLPDNAPIGGGQDPMGAGKAGDLRRMFDQHMNAWIGGTSSENDDNAAAFQLCVWEIIYETGAYNPTEGYFRTSSTAGWVTTTAAGWLTALAGTEDPFDIGLRVLANEYYQDYALTVPGLGGTPIPEPLTMLGVLGAVAGAGGYVGKHRRNRAPVK